MAITFIGSASGEAINGGDVTVTLPTGSMVTNDLIIVSGGIGDNDNIDFNMAMVTSGYTEVADLYSNDLVDNHLGVYWKLWDGAETTAVFDGQGGTDASAAAIAMVFRGVDTTTPMDVTPTTATGIDTANPNPPSINHNNPSGVWTVCAGASTNNGGTSTTFTFPTGYTTNAVSLSSDDSADVTVGMGYNTSPADPEDPGVMTYSTVDSLNFAWCACTIALRPAPVDTNVTATTGALTVAGIDAIVQADVDVNITATTGTLTVGGINATVTIVPAITGSGVLTSEDSTMSGVGERTVVGSGVLIVTSSSTAGTGERVIIGAGVLVSSDATVSGLAAGIVTQLTSKDNDIFIAWLELNTTGIADNIDDLSMIFLDEQGIEEGNINDRWDEWLEQAPRSYIGSLSDKWDEYING